MVRKLIFCCLLNTSLHMDNKNEEISSRSRDLEKRACGERHHRPVRKITPTTSLLDRSNIIYGREKDKEVILELLLEGKVACDGRVCVVAIGGKEGVGKTTLAQLVYNDSTVVNSFDLRAWIFVSEGFDVLSITETILQGVTKEVYNLSDDLNLLQVALRKNLSGKSCLIVLDNVCNVGYEQWDLLCQPFVDSEVKIVVTTRNNTVPPILAAISTQYDLDLLSDDDCLAVLVDHAQPKKKFDTDPKLQAIVAKIACKCEGLPKAAKHFGGRLRYTHDYTQWEKIYIELSDI